MKLLPFIIGLVCSSNVLKWNIRNLPNSVEFGEENSVGIHGQEVYDINSILTGNPPSHMTSSTGKHLFNPFVRPVNHILALKHFDPFSPIEKAVIIITSENDIPESIKQFQLKTTLSRPSIEVILITRVIFKTNIVIGDKRRTSNNRIRHFRKSYHSKS